MILIKSKHALELMGVAGKLLAEMFIVLNNIVKAELTTADIDAWIDNYQKRHNLISCMRGYMGYKHVSCISLNDEVVHGVPSKLTKIKQGDLVKIDVCASYKNYCADMARSYNVGEIGPEIEKFIAVTSRSLDKGIEQAQVGARLSNISAAIQQEVEQSGYGIVREFAGHGIGRKMHEEPEILNYGNPGQGPIIRAGMAFAIEPMTTMGDYNVYIARDGWTVKTVDKSLAMHIEDTIVITEHGPKIITRV